MNKLYLNKINNNKNINYRFEYVFKLNSFLYKSLDFRLLHFYNIYLLNNYYNNLNKNFILKSNILFLDLLNTYVGSRHLRGLPVNGQRTWTNGWNTYKTNTVLRELKIYICKKIYNNQSGLNLPIIYLSEHMNILWKNQWSKEWKLARKKRLFFLKNVYGLYKIDLHSLSTRSFINVNKLKKKTKKSSSKSSFSLGFDSNFTKSLIKLLNNNKNKLKIQIIWSNVKK